MSNGPVHRTVLSLFFVAVFALGVLPKAWADNHWGCSNASLKGSFGFTSSGTLIALPPPLPPSFAGPFTEIGRQTFDGAGNTDSTATLSANGNIVSGVTFQGTYQVSPDCTGSMTLFAASVGVTSHADFVIDDDGAELRAIITDGGVVENRTYRKQFSRDRKE
jgi:hypothetical protein